MDSAAFQDIHFYRLAIRTHPERIPNDGELLRFSKPEMPVILPHYESFYVDLELYNQDTIELFSGWKRFHPSNSGDAETLIIEMDVSVPLPKVGLPASLSAVVGDSVEIQFEITSYPGSSVNTVTLVSGGSKARMKRQDSPNLYGIQWRPTAPETYTDSLIVLDNFNRKLVHPILLAGIAANRPPVLANCPDSKAGTRKTYSDTIRVRDPDEDPITLSLPNAPLSMKLVSNQLVWTPLQQQSGPHRLMIVATDSISGNDTLDCWINVEDSNLPPILKVPIPPTLPGGDTTRKYILTATDPENDPVTIRLLETDTSMSLDSANVFWWTPTRLHRGKNFITFGLEDAFKAKSTTTCSVVILNSPPRFFGNLLPDTISIRAPIVFRDTLKAGDFEDDEIIYSAIDPPDNLKVDSRSGAIIWTLDTTRMVKRPIQFRVTDALKDYSEWTWNVTVVSP